ncbi:hypothetical protein LSAT2_019672 [Lamellibrachia satsuma]|nr:hypothetical protein LSAT2_019672 [Lamellibrachia satsuma]
MAADAEAQQLHVYGNSGSTKALGIMPQLHVLVRYEGTTCPRRKISKLDLNRRYSMVRTYKRNSTQGSYGSDRLALAVAAVREGQNIRGAGAGYGIPRRTLKRHCIGDVRIPGAVTLGRKRCIFSSAFEAHLVDYAKEMSERMYGLTTTDVRRLAFAIAEKLGVTNNFDKEHDKFEKCLAVSVEKTTALCCMSAAGAFIPPLFVFPRKRMVNVLMNGAPAGAIGGVNDRGSGYIDSITFTTWLKHFAAIAGCTKDDPHILLLDGHESHKTLEAIDFAREHGIILLRFPPHCTHRLQPLDRTYFKSLKFAFSRSCDNWLISNKGRAITQYNVMPLFEQAYSSTATVQSAVNGFAVCGLWPFNDSKFDAEFNVIELSTLQPLSAHRVITAQDTTPHAASRQVTSAQVTTSHSISAHVTAPEVITTHVTAPEVITTHVTAPEVITTHVTAAEVITTHVTAAEVITTHVTAAEVITTHVTAAEVITTHVTAAEVITTHVTAAEVITTHVTAPEVITTHVTAAEVITTHVTAPEVITTHVTAAEVITTHVTAPEVITTHVTAAEVITTHVTAPEVITTHVTAAEVITTHVTAPEAITTHVTAPEVITTHVTAPQIVT